MSPIFLALATALLGAVVATAAAADAVPVPRSIAVLEFERQQEPKGGVADRVSLSDAVRQEVSKIAPALTVWTRENLDVLVREKGGSLSEIQSREGGELSVGKSLGVDLIITGRLGNVGTRTKLSLRLHDVRTGEMLSSTSASGDSMEAIDDSLFSTVGDLLERLLARFPTLAQSTAISKPATLTVESRPAGALVLVDNRRIGAAPVLIDGLAPGNHRVEVSLDDFGTQNKEVRLFAGETSKLVLELARLSSKLALRGRVEMDCDVDGRSVHLRPGEIQLIEAPVGVVPVRCSGGADFETSTINVRVRNGVSNETEILLVPRDTEILRHSRNRHLGQGILVVGAALIGGGTFFVTRAAAQNDRIHSGGFATAVDISAAADQGSTYNAFAATGLALGSVALVAGLSLWLSYLE